MNVTVKVSGDADLRRALAKLGGGARRDAQRLALEAGAQVVAARAQDYAPVDTGALRASIRVDDVTPDSAQVSANTDYAAFVELGTSHMAAQPFLRPALDQHEGEIVAAVAAQVAAFVEAAGR